MYKPDLLPEQENGYFRAKDSRTKNEIGEYVGNPNVLIKFDDMPHLDINASREARENVYKPIPGYFAKIEVDSFGLPSKDETTRALKFYAYPHEALEMVLRCPEAWLDYQKRRKAPIQEDEERILRGVFGEDYVAKLPEEPKQVTNGAVVQRKPDELISAPDAAKMLDVKPYILSNHRRLGTGPAYVKDDNGRIFYNKREVLKWGKARAKANADG